MGTAMVSIPAMLMLSVVALSTAQMELPADFQSQASRINVSGFGGKNKGSYVLAGYSGEFKRGESRLGIFDPLYVSKKGKSSFTFRENDKAELISAECAMKKGSVSIGILTFDPKKMSYQCDFRQTGRLLGDRFVLGQPKPNGFKQTFQAYDLRAGEAVIFDQHLTMQSVHNYQGTKLGSPSPVGYLIMANGQPIAAVELTDVNPTFLVLPDLNDDLKRSALIASLALAVLRDPANSALED